MSEQFTLSRSGDEDEPGVGGGPVHRPQRDLPFTADDRVDGALRLFEESDGTPLGEQLAAADEAHRALQAALGG